MLWNQSGFLLPSYPHLPSSPLLKYSSPICEPLSTHSNTSLQEHNLILFDSWGRGISVILLSVCYNIDNYGSSIGLGAPFVYMYNWY
jgi:hypothetical protein